MPLEEALCPIRDYERGLSDRLTIDKLSVDSICTVIFAIRATQLAIRFPARITNLAMPRPENVKFEMLNSDLQKTTKAFNVRLCDGIIQTDFTIINFGVAHEGYFFGGEDDIDRGLRELFVPIRSSLDLVTV